MKNLFKIIITLYTLTLSLYSWSVEQTSSQNSLVIQPTAYDFVHRSSVLTRKISDDKQNLDLVEKQYERLKLDLEGKNSDSEDEKLSTGEEVKKYELKLQKANFSVDSIAIDIKIAQQEILSLNNSVDTLEKQLAKKISEKTSAVDGKVADDIKELQQKINNDKQLLVLARNRLGILQKNSDVAKKIQSLAKDGLDKSKLKLGKEQQSLKDNQQILEEQSLQQDHENWQQKATALKKQLFNLGQSGLIPDQQHIDLDNKILEADANVNLNTIRIALLRLNAKIALLPLNWKEISDPKEQHNFHEQVTDLLREEQGIEIIINNFIELLKLKKTTQEESYKNKFISRDNYQKSAKLINDFQISFVKEQQKLIAIKEKLNFFLSESRVSLNRDIFERDKLPESFSDWKSVLLELKDLPALIWYNVENFISQIVDGYEKGSVFSKYLIFIFEVFWLAAWFVIYRVFSHIKYFYKDADTKSFSFKAIYVASRIITKNIWLFAIFTNFLLFIWLYDISYRVYFVVVALSILYLIFSSLLLISQILLLENVGDVSGRDVKLYYGLRYSLFLGFILTSLLLLTHQLSETLLVEQLIDRLFMVFLLVVSFPLLRGWDIVPNLIEEKLKPRPYVKKTLRFVAFLFPLTVLSSAIIGLLGFVNLAWRIWVVEGRVLFVIALWSILSGLIADIMGFVSTLFIKQVTNGWLWNESVLKPITKLLNLVLFLLAVFAIFVFSGWAGKSFALQSLHIYLDTPIFFVSDTTPITLNKILASVFVLLIVVWATKWSREFSYRWVFKNTKDLGSRNSFAVFLQYIVAIIGFLVLLLGVLEIPFANISLALAGLTVGLGLALRGIVEQLVSGFVLLLERPVRTGDRVTIDKFEGEITKIGMRSVTLRTWDYMEVIIPNADLVGKAVTNWTFQDYIVRTVVPVRVAFHDDPLFVQEILYNALKESEYVAEDPSPEVFLDQFAEYSLIFNVRYYIDLRKNSSRPRVKSMVMLELWRALKAQGIVMPYPKQEVIFDDSSAFPSLEFDSETDPTEKGDQPQKPIE